MKRDLYLKTKEIFLEVEEVTWEERGDLLCRLCASDEELRAEVESLLAHEESDLLDGPIPEPVLAAALGDPSPGLIGRRLGPFRICALLGEGGMGRVWRAEQDHPRRAVAVKVVRSAIATVEGLRRFQQEVELLGRLQHPGIAQIYHADIFDLDGHKVPYFAMELVPGARALDRYVAEVDPDLRARVELFEMICAAVHHGHQRGIIHRDLKPANVLVDGDGHPKVIDFGVARATNSDVTVTSLHTRVGELVGTLRYMSPEQCESDPGGLDSRSDVYSLGVMLYEVLCQQPPYEITDLSIPSAMGVIREHDPCPPGELDARLRGSLEAIVLKAMHKDRERRYGSAAELGADLRRWLEGEPVQARPPSRFQQGLRWSIRHPILLTGLVSAVIVVVALLTAWLGIRFLASAPAQTVLDEENRSVALLTRVKHQLHTWDSGVPQGIVYSDRVDRAEILGGGSVALIGYAHASRSPFAGELCAYDFDRPETPSWTSHDEEFPLPPGAGASPGVSFVLQQALVADFLPDSPGQEILATFVWDPYSPQAIRVYDANGGLRYQVFHDGGIRSLHFLPKAQRLVLSGFNSEVKWHARGLDTRGSSSRYPAVAFALEILDGHVQTDQWLVEGGRRPDSTLSWYKWIGPAENVCVFEDGFPSLELASELDGKELVTLSLVAAGGMAWPPFPGIYFVLDAAGTVERSYGDDGYKAGLQEGRLPPSSVFRLFDYEDLPPILPAPTGAETDGPQSR